ncbi:MULTISPECIES: GntR family transcriptional regulator [Brucella/Ochrobactrum group]|jgi:DNA-binding GntR family transcriptional regulator|uniref:GntR family transcriptional regulator n=1 Tax=Brucella/Ochrobactrum group TaxID=2826938 RepID=UPI001C05D679|nr:GntR family transcriptional regulator [Brucella sp. NBRC 12950]QWK80988.1 GntR family transcriptional regulator [Ochrobactrum sp. BTU1]GLU27421.1 GntR family transcriptional regulator [Brucella sp. NBRC 12950]
MAGLLGSTHNPERPVPGVGAPPTVGSILNAIRNDIITLRLMPGKRVSENELAKHFGTSRTPVREALLRLVDQGLVEVWPQRGTFIMPISLAAVQRARFVRNAVEVAVFKRAAEEGLSPSTLAELDAVIAKQEGSKGSPEDFTIADDAFHRTVANGIRMGDIWSLLEREKAQFDRLRFLSLPNVTPVELLIEQHKAMLSAIRRRDPIAAEAAVHVHLSEVLKVTEHLAQRYSDLIVNDL